MSEHLPIASDEDPICGSKDPDDPLGLICNRIRGHEDAHAAYGSDEDRPLHVWACKPEAGQ